MGRATAIIFWPRPPGEGSKGQISFNFKITKSFSKIFFQTLCLFSQIKDTNPFRRDFNFVAWVMPQGSDFGALGVPRGVKLFFSKHGHVAYQIDGDDKQNKMQVKFSS